MGIQTPTPVEQGGNPSPPLLASVQGWLHTQKGPEPALLGWRGNPVGRCLPISIFQAFAFPQSSSDYLDVHYPGLEATENRMPTPPPHLHPGHTRGSLSYWRPEGDRGWLW